MTNNEFKKKLILTELYRDVVEHFGPTQQECADRLGIAQGSVAGWVTGRHGMSPKIAIAVDKASQGRFPKEALCPETFGAE